jgi:hypothetical protein
MKTAHNAILVALGHVSMTVSSVKSVICGSVVRAVAMKTMGQMNATYATQ